MFQKKGQAKDTDGISNVKAWLVCLASVLVVFTVLIMYLALASEKPDYKSVEVYVGMSKEDAVQKADDEKVDYQVYPHDQRAAVLDRAVVGLILYVSDDEVVGAEKRSPRQDSRAAPFVGLPEDEAVQMAKNDGREHRIVERDDEDIEVTNDFRPSRINFSVIDGKVTKAEFY